MTRYYDMDKLAKMMQAKADTLIEGKEAFLYVAKWLELLPADDVAPRAEAEQWKAEADAKHDLEYTLLGVMHSVDKWLDGAELEQDEVNRAATMREKTLRIVEGLTAKVDELENELSWKDARSIMYVSKECPKCGRVRVEHYTNGKHVCEKCHWCIEENQYRESIFKYL